MHDEQVIMDCSKMSDDELIRALTFHPDNYSAPELQLMTRELARRKRDIAAFIDSIQASLNDAEPEDCTINQALAKLKQEISLWQVWHFTNCVGETIDLQKEVSFWTIHVFEQEEYQQSCLIKTAAEVEKFLSQFLRLSEEEYTVDYEYRLDECETLMDSSASGTIEKLSAALARADIPHTVRRVEFMTLNVLIPPEYFEAANGIAAEIENKIQTLREEIAALVERNARSPRLLELYEQLAQLVEGDPAVSYGRGILLFESGRNEEAAEAFIETLAAPPGQLPDEDYEAYRTESQAYLVRLAAALPRNVSILHALASKAMSEQDNANAIKYYEAILTVAPADSIAHMNLGFLYYQDPNYNSRAVEHFRAYLQQQPNAEDRPAIEEILAQLQT